MKTLLCIRRNLKKIPFGAKEGVTHLYEELNHFSWIRRGVWIEIDNPEEERLLLKSFYTTEKGSCYWMDRSGAILIHLGKRDHLTLRSTLPWKEVKHYLQELHNHFSFAYSPRFGFVTSNLEDAGTAMKAMALVPGRVELSHPYVESVPFYSHTLFQNRLSLTHFETTTIDYVAEQARSHAEQLLEEEIASQQLLEKLLKTNC